jgi:hypothetical protein
VQRDPFSKHLLDAHPTAYVGISTMVTMQQLDLDHEEDSDTCKQCKNVPPSKWGHLVTRHLKLVYLILKSSCYNSRIKYFSKSAVTD